MNGKVNHSILANIDRENISFNSVHCLERKVSPINFIALQCGQTLYIFPICTNLHEILYECLVRMKKQFADMKLDHSDIATAYVFAVGLNVVGAVETIVSLFFLSIQFVKRPSLSSR